MKQLFVAAALLIGLAGCAAFGPPPNIGDTEQQVVARLGQPTHRYADGQSHLLEYMHGPWGQSTYMARIGPEGRLVSYEQVLTPQKFGQIEVGKATKEDVLRIIGAPSETSYLTLSQREVWSYPYLEQGLWDSMMHVHFDNSGIVRMLQNGPDPRRMPSDSGKF